MWTLWKTAFVAVFQVPCGRVRCVHRDDSVHIVFDRAELFNNVEPRRTALRSPDVQNEGDLEVDRGHDRRSFSETASVVKPPTFFVFFSSSFQ
jgi:hypothetical protein